jgi:hypothetical protein
MVILVIMKQLGNCYLVLGIPLALRTFVEFYKTKLLSCSVFWGFAVLAFYGPCGI